MCKRKIGVLILGALVSLSAQAQSSSVLYGMVDLFAQYLDGTAHQSRLQSSGLAGSRLGFRGTEDLGDGFHALFTLEMGLNLDDGTLAQGGLAFGRQAFVGLNDAWGEVTLGRQYGSLYRLGAEFSAFGIGSAGPSTLTIGGFPGGYEPFRGASATALPPAAGATGNGGPARINNSIRYASPHWEGWQLTAMAGLGEGTTGADSNRLVDIGLRFTSGPADVIAFYVSDMAGSAIASTDASTVGVGGTYSFSGTNKIFAGAIAVDDRRPENQGGVGYWLGGEHKWDAQTIRLQWLQNRPRHASDNRTTALGVGHQLDLSKRVALYSSATRFTNGANAGVGGLGRFSTSIPVGPTRPGHAEITEFVAGIRLIF